MLTHADKKTAHTSNPITGGEERPAPYRRTIRTQTGGGLESFYNLNPKITGDDELYGGIALYNSNPNRLGPEFVLQFESL